MRARREDGISLLGLLVGATIVLLFLTAALPSWRYTITREREEELIFRGCEIANAVNRFKEKNGGALPTDRKLAVLVRGHYLRRAYRDPMMPDGVWQFVGPNEPPPSGPSPRSPSSPSPSPSLFASPFGSLGGGSGPFIGVASRSKEKSFRVFNGKSKYHEWRFTAGPQCMVGTPSTAASRLPLPSPSPRGSFTQ